MKFFSIKNVPTHAQKALFILQMHVNKWKENIFKFRKYLFTLKLFILIIYS